MDSIKDLAIGAGLSINLFLDISFTNRTKDAFRKKFFDLFGIQGIIDKIENESPFMCQRPPTITVHRTQFTVF